MPRQIPTSPANITPDWLTETLRAAKATTVQIAAVHFARIGEDEGFTGCGLYRITLTYDRADPASPQTLVAKLAPQDPEMRNLMRAANAREAEFYQSQMQDNPLPLPRCYHADFDTKTGASILLLQDLRGYRSVPFIKGCGLADAKKVVEALAALHAKWWNSAALAPLSGVSMMNEYPFDQVWPQYSEKVRSLLQGIEIPVSFIRLGTFIAQNQTQVFNRLFETAPITRLHRDVQADNVVFAKPKGSGTAVLFDWQFAGKGRGPYDVGYFLISSVDPSPRRNLERGLVAHYHAELLQAGVTEYSLAQCWADYVQSVAGKIYITVAATVLLDNSSPHKQAWRRADLRRLLAFCADHRISEHTFRV